MLDRLCWAEINLKNYAYNFNCLKKHVGTKVKVMAVVKANAYGHGAVEIAKYAEKIGYSSFGVVCLYEAKVLRENSISKPILILNYTDPDAVAYTVDHNITLNVMDEQVLKVVDRYARKKKKIVRVHVKIDSGMHRLGLAPEQALRFVPKIEQYKNIALEGIFTHFATSDEKNLDFAYTQLTQFQKVLGQLVQKGIRPPLIHAANSAATMRIPQSHFDMVRPGIASYGLSPSSDFRLPLKLKPVLSLKTKIVQIRKITKGESVGYGRGFIATRDTLVASLPIGYADGFRRAPANFGSVMVKGLKVPILGRVSMDQSSVDVTGVPNILVGDEVVIIGKQGNTEISAESVARQIGTINYEVVAALAERVFRIYINS